MSPRTAALLLSLAFLLPAALPATTASTGPTVNGDVVINGAFRDGTPAGHPAKYNNATMTYVAYDWVGQTSEGTTGAWTLVDDGLRMTKTGGAGDVVLQQYFNGSFAFSREMDLFGVSVTAYAAQANTQVQLALRYRDETGANQAGIKSLVLGTTPRTFTFEPSELGVPAGERDLVSVRLITSATNVPVTFQRVSVYATNGVDPRNLHVLTGGDDVLVPGGDAALLAPGADGKYTFLVGVAADNGDFLPALDAWVCLYAAEQVIADNGFPENLPRPCQGAFLAHDSPRIVKTREGDAFRFDVDASAVRPPTGFSGAVALYATVEIDGSYSDADPAGAKAWKTGYYNLARVAADRAGAGVSREFYTPTPVFVDGDADGAPDFVQTDELDHHAAIITPLHGHETPAVTVVTPTIAGDYEFLVEVYRYPDARDASAGAPPTGEPLALDERGVGFGVFDATLLTSGGAPDFAADALWTAGAADVERVSPTQYLVRVPASAVPGDRVVGAWAFYDVDGAHERRTAFEPAFGPSDTAFDFYSSVQTAAKTFAFADGFRNHFTPIVLDAGSQTNDATLVIRKVGDDDVTALDGALLVDPGADGKVSFAYAMVLGQGRTHVGDGHGFAVYDAAGVASDNFAPGGSGLKHAEWVGQGVLQDGWYRIDVPASAFADAKGPVGLWAYVDEESTTPKLSRSGYFNVLKPSVAALSTSAAEKALYPATPLVLVDRATGLPADLVGALRAAPGLVSFQNPLVNPGFEADMLVEGARESRDAYGGTMTSPPWFFRLDDKGTGQATTPASRHEVVRGQGRGGGNAMAVQYSTLDNLKGLMLGQLLGVEHAKAGFAWEDATGVALDVRNPQQPMKLRADLHYLTDAGEVRVVGVTFAVPVSDAWQRLEAPWPVPVDGRLLGLYLMPRNLDSSSRFFLDNVAVTGSRTVLGDARTDVTDGYAVVIEPAMLANGAVSRVGGASGAHYLFNLSVVAYEGDAARQVDFAEAGDLSFGLRTSTLAKDLGAFLRLRGRDDLVTAVLPAAAAPQTPAAPWAYARLGDAYQPLANPAYAMQPASGYYSPLKNALRGDPLADRLDYAGTPVTFAAATAANLSADQQIDIVGTPAEGYRIRVTARTPFVEQTTLTVSSPTQTRAFPVTLDSDAGNLVAGLLIPHAELSSLTFRTAGTLFTRGALVVAGDPVAALDACHVDALPACTLLGVKSGQAVRFTDRTLVPGGETYARNWNFGDGTGSSSAATVDHAFARPGEYLVKLTVTTASGKRDETTVLVAVENRDPAALGLDVAPATIHVDSLVTAQARANDPDGGTLAYTWFVEGVEVPDASGRTLTLTPAVLAATTPEDHLVRGAYDIAYVVTDGQGGDARFDATFTVADAAPTAQAPRVSVVGVPGAQYALVGETLRIVALASDKDDPVTGVVASVGTSAAAIGIPMTLVAGEWVAEFTTAMPEPHLVNVAATSASGTVESAVVTLDVREDAAPLAALAGPSLVQAGETATFTANGSADPDARGPLAYEWLVDGEAAGAERDLALDPTALAVGTHVVTLRVTDATGLTTERTTRLDVDDTLTVTVQVSNVGLDGLATATFLVVDEQGRPVAGALIDAKDFVGPLPDAMASATLVTNATGVATWEIPGVGPLQVPLEHRLEALARAASHAGAPVADTEEDAVVLTYGGVVLP